MRACGRPSFSHDSRHVSAWAAKEKADKNGWIFERNEPPGTETRMTEEILFSDMDTRSQEDNCNNSVFYSFTQFSTFNPLTLSNSFLLLVTMINLFDLACAANNKSIVPISLPSFSNSFLISPKATASLSLKGKILKIDKNSIKAILFPYPTSRARSRSWKREAR